MDVEILKYHSAMCDNCKTGGEMINPRCSAVEEESDINSNC